MSGAKSTLGLATLVALAGATLFMSAAAQAGDASNPLTNHYSFSLGGFAFDTNTTVRLDGETSRGSDVDLEDDLGFGDKNSFRIDGYWRFGESGRHKVRLM